MNDYELDKNSKQKFVIATKQGNVEILWPIGERPGFCPHCSKCIPLYSIAFKKEQKNGMDIYSGMDAVKRKKGDGLEEVSLDKNSKIGECPYCHRKIPMREVLLKKADE